MKHIGAFIVLILWIFATSGQENPYLQYSQKTTIQGKTFFLYNVQKGVTLYSLSKAFGTSMDSIFKYNPAISAGLKTGMEIKIPVISANSPKVAIQNTGYMVFHIIKQGETIYSIGKIYKTESERIFEWNPGLKNQVNPGDIIKILISDPGILPELPEYHYHIVEKGQTLYSISNIYQVKVKQIVKSNPHLEKQELTTSEIIKIPKSKSKIDLEIATDMDDTYYYHEVDKKQTLYAISNIYHIGLDLIINANPHLKDQPLREGEIIKIPKKIAENIPDQHIPDVEKNLPIIQPMTEELKVSQDSCVQAKVLAPCPETFSLPNRPVSFSILLPLYTSINDTLNLFLNENKTQNQNAPQAEKIYPRSEMGIEMYEGVLLALEELKNRKVETILNTFDTESDQMPISQVINQIRTNKSDFVICPNCQPGHALYTALEDTSCHFIVPFIGNDNFNATGSFAFLVPSEKYQAECMLDLLKTNQVDTLIFIYDSTSNENFIRLIKNILYKENKIFIKELYIISNQDTIPDTIFNSNKTNFVIVPSEDQAFVTDIIGKLNAFADKFTLELYGRPKWSRFENIDIEYFFRMHTYLISFSPVDYKNEQVKKFVKSFRQTFCYEPDKYAFAGYDVMMLFNELLQYKGFYYPLCLDGFKPSSTLNNYHLVLTSRGIENQLIHVLKFDSDFQIRTCKVYPQP